MHIGIIGSLLICTVLYILVSGIATGVMSYKELNVPDPIAVVADHAGLGWMSTLIKLGAIAGLSSVILVMLLGQSRVFYSMARDGLLPPFVNKVHPKFQTPYLTSIVTGVIVAFFAAILPIRDAARDRKSTRLNSSHSQISYAVFCLKKKKNKLPLDKKNTRLTSSQSHISYPTFCLKPYITDHDIHKHSTRAD